MNELLFFTFHDIHYSCYFPSDHIFKPGGSTARPCRIEQHSPRTYRKIHPPIIIQYIQRSVFGNFTCLTLTFSATKQFFPPTPQESSVFWYFHVSTTVCPLEWAPVSSTSTRNRVALKSSGWAAYAMVSASCIGGPSIKPKVDLYDSAKYPMRVERVYLRFVSGLGNGAFDPTVAAGDKSFLMISLVAMAVWVTLIGIMTVRTGAFKTI